MTTPTVALIVLTWNQRDLTLDCLASLAALDYPADRLEVVVVDNGSVDGTAEAVRAAYPGVTLLETGENLGYAGGNNVGIRYALEQGADYVLILNNDVTVAPDFLGPLLAAMGDGEDVGIVTPLLADGTEPDRVWALGARVDRRTGRVDRLHVGESVADVRARPPLEVDAASGAAMMVRASILPQVGLMDEAFYLYYEEIDWCLRVRRAGHRILAVPASLAWHRVSATLGATSPVIDYYMTRNQVRFLYRHWSAVARWRLLGRAFGRHLLTVAAYTAKSHGGQRIRSRNARLLALRDALLGRWGKMGPDVAQVCYPKAP